jgi:hypothetical protein
MAASRLAYVSLALCAACAFANAFFYLADPNYPPAWGDRWVPVETLAVVYALLGLLGWSQRGDAVSGTVVLSACLLGAAIMLFGRGADWLGSAADPSYYNRVIRLGSVAGGVAQVVCLALAAALVAGLRGLRWATK